MSIMSSDEKIEKFENFLNDREAGAYRYIDLYNCMTLAGIPVFAVCPYDSAEFNYFVRSFDWISENFEWNIVNDLYIFVGK